MKPPKQPGLYPSLPFEDYLAIPAVHSSGLRALRHGPREYQHRQRFALRPTQSMLDGTLAHIQILDPQAYLRRVVEWTEPVYEDPPPLKWEKEGPTLYVDSTGCYRIELATGSWRASFQGALLPHPPGTVTLCKAACKEHYERVNPRRPKLDADGKPVLSPRNEKSAAYRDFLARNPGRTVVTRADLEKAAAVARAVRENPSARRLLSERWQTEYTVVWEQDGVLCKARLDWLTDPSQPVVTIGELKLCRDNEEAWFVRDAARREYHAQLEWYGRGLRAHFPSIETQHVILAVCQTGSHDSTVFDVGADEIDAGEAINDERWQWLLDLRDRYGDGPWPGKCERAPLDFARFAPHALPDDVGLGGPSVDFGDLT
jgi:hypothetical protein